VTLRPTIWPALLIPVVVYEPSVASTRWEPSRTFHTTGMYSSRSGGPGGGASSTFFTT
jgi:hypothetical protein